MKVLFIALLFISVSAHSDTSYSLFGTDLVLRTSAPKDEAAIGRVIKDVKANTQAFDPDCYYSPKEGACPAAKQHALSKDLDALSAKMKAETNGNFDVFRNVGDKKMRDYGGLIQGYLIDELKKTATAPFAVNFAGDIFISPGVKNAPSLSVEDALVKGVKLATVSMGSGWMLGSVSPLGGSKIVDPATGNEIEKPDFHKVLLFAKPEFSGARLDAWSTALIVGGRKLLDQLYSISEFKGQWGYMIVDNQERPFCSPNLVCDFKQGIGQNYIQVSW